MKTLTISFKLQGTAHILGADWQWRIDDGFDMPYKLFAQSGSTAINPATNKIQYLYDMGELFVCKINFYYPIEMWTFAISTKSKQGKIGWKYA